MCIRDSPWGRLYGYCVWNSGTNVNIGGTVACDDDSDGTEQRLEGSPNNYDVVLAIVSAGPDRSFDTTCQTFDAADADDNDVLGDVGDGEMVFKTSGSDDIILSYTYAEAATIGGGGLWSIKSSDPGTATIDKAIEFSGGLSMGTASSGVTVCDASSANVMRFNPFNDSIEVCDGAGVWNSLAAGVTGNDTEVQFNNAGSPGADAGLTYDLTNDILNVGSGLIVGDALTLGVTAGAASPSLISIPTAGFWTDNSSHISYQNFHILNPGDTMVTAGFEGTDFNGLVWHSDKSALMFGNSGTTSWNQGNIGDYTLSVGNGSHAQGINSIAFGEGITVSGDNSFGVNLSPASTTLSQNNRMGLYGGDFLIDDDGTAGSQGCIRYTEGIGLQYSNDCSTFTALGTGSGIFEISSSVARVKSIAGNYANDDFVFGSPQLADDGDASHDNRFWFDKSKGAFRAGTANSTQWDDGNVGTNSVAIGYRNTASGNYSHAFGWTNTASGSWATAVGAENTSSGASSFVAGWRNTASGGHSMAVGHDTTAAGSQSAAIGRDVTVTATGDQSFAFGLGIAAGTVPQVSGANSFGIFMGDQSSVDLSDANTMSIMGASGGFGIETLSPGYTFDVNGDINYSGSLTNISDIRLKEDIKEIDDALEKISNLQGISYNLIDDEDKKKRLGFSAQELQKIYPELVSTDDNGTLAVNYIGLIAPLVESVKTLKDQNDDLQAQIEEIGAPAQADHKWLYLLLGLFGGIILSNALKHLCCSKKAG